MPFQNRVNLYNPRGVEGDFASANPRASTIASEGGLVAGAPGVTVGTFGWVGADGRTVTNVGAAGVKPSGFLGRQMGTAVITQYLAETGNTIQPGFMVTLHDEGDFFVIVRGQAAVNGSPIFAESATGLAYTGAAPAGGGVATNFVAKEAGNVGDLIKISTWGN